MAKLTLQLDLCGKALATLSAILAEPFSTVVRDASIQRFEYCFEIVWKTMKTWLEERHGIVCASPKAAFREALSVGLVDATTAEVFVLMADSRNLTSHTYWEGIAQRIYAELPGYCGQMVAVLDRMKAEAGG